MVTGMRPGGGRRGASSTGCLISLLIFVGLLYYGVNIGEVWFRYYQLVDEMKTQARLAAAARRVATDSIAGRRRVIVMAASLSSTPHRH